MGSRLIAWLVPLTMAFSVVGAGCSACSSTDTSRLYPSGEPGEDGSTGACPSGLFPCGDECVDRMSDEANCGGCSRACGTGEDCRMGECICPDGTTCSPPDAGGGGGGGLGDPSNCGGMTCNDDEVCVDQSCRCRAGRTRVDGACVDLNSDPDNCGSPGNRCPDATVCASGTCQLVCPPGTTECAGSCVRPLLDPAHCGECGNRCARDEFCDRGGCTQYRGGTGCTTCPCDTCTGDFSTCCPVAGAPGLVACIEEDSCF